MKYLVFFLFRFCFKSIYTIWWIVSRTLQLFWSFNFKDVDMSCIASDLDFSIHDGYYCKSLKDFWIGKISFSQEVKDKNPLIHDDY